MMKEQLCTTVGMVGGFIAALLGGWDTGLQTLMILIGIDYLTGLIVAGVFHKSTKTKNGALVSKAGFKGLCRKAVILLIVLMAYRFDMLIHVNYIRDAVIIGFISNEAISIVENAGLMGIPMPPQITKAIEILTKKSEEEHRNEEN